MLLLSDYKIIERINVDSNKVYYRAERSKDREKVILKILENKNCSSEEAAGIANEYEIAGSLSYKGIARYLKLETFDNRNVFVLADIEGVSFKEYLKDNKTDIGNSLKIALSITEILGYFHQEDIVHQDLCPANLLINPQTLEVNLVDLSTASRVSALNRSVPQPNFLKGSLIYISPEQTGRIKGEIDLRSDLYSLGVILYELFTGRVPFEAKEALSLIHCHIAKSPDPPHLINKHIPVSISAIILKLLSKNAIERYQSPFGLIADLRTCLNQWSIRGSIELFDPGGHDFSGRLQNPKQFYGREKEMAPLEQAFNRVNSGAAEIVLVEGYSGIGKSALVHRVKALVQDQGEIFIEGKFNQFQRNIPYFAFIQAFKEFTDYILMQSIEMIAAWKQRIIKAVGVNGRLLTDIIPHLESLIGSQPGIPDLEPNEAQNRFHYVFLNFIRGICEKNHPLVIFFDDLQWSDAASSNLLRIIVTDKALKHFLFIGAYRDNEMAANSIFSITIENMKKEGCLLQKIMLLALPYKNVEEIIFETVKNRVKDSQSLVHLIYDKSQGNPFFINSFLKCLHAENILVFDFYSYEWKWDATKVNQLKFTENIVELMTGRIRRLPGDSQELLKLAAFLGYHLDVRLLVILLQVSMQEIVAKIEPAVNADLILRVGNNYSFTHDRIQQAAYSLVPDDEKKLEHLKIGRALLLNLDAAQRNNYIFEIVNQLNAGIESITSREEKEELAALDLTAGIKAKSSAAYKPSFEYLQIGISLLNDQIWENDYQRALQLYTEGAESAFLSGNNDLMEEWIEVVLQNASTVLDKVRVYEIRIKFFVALHKLTEAVQTALQVLELLNVRFPQNPTRLHVLAALIQIKIVLLGKSPETLIDLPLIKNLYAEAAIRVLISVGSAVYYSRPGLLPLVQCKLFYLMIRYGNSSYSGVICTAYALILIAGIEDFNEGYKLGKIAMQLSEKFDAGSLKCQSRMMFNTFIVHWKEHIKNTLEPLANNYWYGLENGNIEFAAYCAFVYTHNAFFCGKNLQELTVESEKYIERLKGLKHEIALNTHRICSQAILNLAEKVENPTVLTGRVHNEEKMIFFHKETKGETGLYKIYLNKLILSYLFERYSEAQQNAEEAVSYLKSVPGSPEVMIFYFYDTLTKLSMLHTYSGRSKSNLEKKIYSNCKKFKKFAQFAPMNASHKLLLIEAELCRVTGRLEKAALLYDNAIEEAGKNEYINDLALSCELAGKFYHSQNRGLLSQHYLLNAYKFYEQWGAFNKVRDMDQKYPYLLEKHQMERSINSFRLNSEQTKFSTPGFLPQMSSQELDLDSILKATVAISSEVQLSKLLRKLVRIAVENAGAQKGYLILKKDSELCIEAEGSINPEEEVVVQSVPIKGNKSVSEAIVQFVWVTKENLVIDNAIEHPVFSLDPVVIGKISKSILCMPVLHQGIVLGLLYFENDLITNAFTQDRIELLRLLSGQMAISLQNALNEQKKMNALMEREKLLGQINLHQQELLKTKLEIQEQTFHNISGEIHDNIGQALSFIKLNINTIDVNLPDIAREKLFELQILLTKVIQDLRDLAKTLNTDYIDKIGLVDAIDRQLQFLKKTGLYTVKLSIKGEVVKYESQNELVLFRIVQELLNNVVKHAQATTIDIILEYQSKKLVIIVSDNGKGFENKKQQLQGNDGLGLRNIQNRITLINGNILFESEPGKGTTVTIELLR